MGNKTLLITLLIALLVGAAGAWYVTRPVPDQSALHPLTSEGKAYVRNLELSDVTLKATESYVQQMVTEIEGKIANRGDRSVKLVDLYCVFYNSYGEVVRRVRVPIVKGALKPGESRPFRLPFDDIPKSWNNQMPQLVIASVEFG